MIPLAPIGPTALTCLNCGKDMRREVMQYKNGKVHKIVFYCDPCKYGYEPSMVHAPGQSAKYVAPEPPVPEVAAVPAVELKKGDVLEVKDGVATKVGA